MSILKRFICPLFLVFILCSCAGEAKKRTPASYTVEIRQMKFQPEVLVVQKGDTIVWINNDIVIHDVTEESNKAWTSSLMPVGESWSLIVNQSADYYCSIHVVMKGKLIVQ